MKPLNSLNRALREENNARRDRIRDKDWASVESSIPLPSHEEVIADFKARQVKASLPAHVEGAKFRVTFRQVSDRWEQVRHFATAEDREAYIAALGGAVVVRVWEAA